MDYLYHGSSVRGLKQLEPRKRFTPAGKIDYAAVYASPLKLIAAAHSFPWTSDEGVDIVMNGADVELVIPTSLKTRLEIPISIYKVSATLFHQTAEEQTGQTWDTKDSIVVLEEETYPSVLRAFQYLGGKIRFI